MANLSPTLTTATQYVEAANGVRFAYRLLASQAQRSEVPLVMHIHFRGNMDFWDPALLDPLAKERTILIFDQAGVGRSSGTVANTIQGWAEDLLAFVDALQLRKIDLLGFSMGGMAVQQVALTRPSLIRKLILAGTGPSTPSPSENGKSIVWPREERSIKCYLELRDAVATDNEQVEDALAVSFFTHDGEGRKACQQYRQRVAMRNVPGEATILEFLDKEKTSGQAQASVEWAKHNAKNSFSRLAELKMPVLVANGDDDLLIPTSRSWELLSRITNAGLIVYPKAGHGFLWQYAPQFAKDINSFLDGWPQRSGANL